MCAVAFNPAAQASTPCCMRTRQRQRIECSAGAPFRSSGSDRTPCRSPSQDHPYLVVSIGEWRRHCGCKLANRPGAALTYRSGFPGIRHAQQVRAGCHRVDPSPTSTRAATVRTLRVGSVRLQAQYFIRQLWSRPCAMNFGVWPPRSCRFRERQSTPRRCYACRR